MKKNVWILVACLTTAGVVGSIALPAQAQASIDVQIGPSYMPPPPQYELMPVLQPGYTWVSGYWQWRDGCYVWRRGYGEHDRLGYHWHEPCWEQGPHGWQMYDGGWDRGDDGRWRGGDRDRDWDHDRRDRDDRYHCSPGRTRKGEC